MLQYTKRFWPKNIGLSFAFWCYFINCWQNLGNPSSSQIPLRSLWFTSVLFSVVFHFGVFFYATNHCSCLCHKYRIALLQSIYAAARHHTNQINALQVQVAQNGDMANAVRVKKSILATFYVYVVFLVCYLPISCVVFAKTIGETVLLSHLWYFSLTLVYLNSSLNPLIYCWKMRHIWQTVMDHILWNILGTDWFAIIKN